MLFRPLNRKHQGLQTSPWIIVGAVVILLTIVIVLAIQNINREKHNMTRILSEKGTALITAVEAGARTGMMGMMWGGNQVQALLEETARLPDVMFLAVTDKSGLILAHSDKARIGGKFHDNFSLRNLDPETQTHWQLSDNGNSQRFFEVYQYFQPMTYADFKIRDKMVSMMKRNGMMMGRGSDWCLPENPTKDRRIIFVGLNVAPFENARKEDIRNTLIISSVLLLLGFGGFISLFWAQSYRSARRSLQDTSAFADEVVTHLPVGLIATDRYGKIAFFNDAAEKITGLNLQEARGKDPEIVLPSHWCGLKEYLDQGETVLEKEMECVFSGQQAVPVSISATRIVNEEGHFVGNILILRDLGEVRRLQEEVRRKEKMAALGGLAAGVAHEIRNPLSSIKGLASYFGGKFAEGSDDRQAAGVMIQEVDRLNRVISELLDFARPSELKLKPTNVIEMLAHSARLVQQDAGTKNIEIHWSGSKNLPQVQLDVDRFSQCLLNLYLNAIQSMDAGGVLSINCSPGDNENIRVEIADTGKGISSSNLKKIFDPYFTTKSTGTGLGLAIVHKIIEAHQGNIKVTSTAGKGTVFTIFIPIQPDESHKKRSS
jgi:two-component system sensor histidine kinase HydH